MCSVALGQKMYDYDREEPYGYFRLVGITYDGDYIVRDYDKTALNGFYEDGYCEFFKVEYKEAWTDDEGEHEAGYYYIDDDPDYVRYVAIATANDADGAQLRVMSMLIVAFSLRRLLLRTPMLRFMTCRVVLLTATTRA